MGVDKKEKQLRQDLINYLRKNAPWLAQTDLEQFSVTALAIFKDIIESKLADRKKQKELSTKTLSE